MLGRNEESAWQRASASLDATAKIYGYRVDSVHTETFKFLVGLNRNKKDLNAKEENDELGQDNDVSKKKEKVKRGINTLETNIRKLNLDKYDIDSEVDPLFSVMTSKFNESTARGLLLNTIPLDENINYILESKKNEDNPQSDINLNKMNIIQEENKKEEDNS
jgi:condensin complex subunit 2